MSATLRLYETVEALETVEAWLLENEGDLTPELEALLDTAGHDFTDKVERTALKVLELKRAAEAASEEGKRLAGLAAVRTRAADRLKDYLERNLRAANRPKVTGTLVTVALQKNGPSVLAPAWDEEALKGMAVYAPQFVTVKPATYSLDKRAILDAHKKGEAIPEEVTITQSESLRIR